MSHNAHEHVHGWTEPLPPPGARGCACLLRVCCVCVCVACVHVYLWRMNCICMCMCFVCGACVHSPPPNTQMDGLARQQVGATHSSAGAYPPRVRRRLSAAAAPVALADWDCGRRVVPRTPGRTRARRSPGSPPSSLGRWVPDGRSGHHRCRHCPAAHFPAPVLPSNPVPHEAARGIRRPGDVRPTVTVAVPAARVPAR